MLQIATRAPDSVYWLGSANKFSNKQAYMFRKLRYWGTQNLDPPQSTYLSPTTCGVSHTMGYVAMTNLVYNDSPTYVESDLS